jgi:hypothetical protein
MSVGSNSPWEITTAVATAITAVTAIIIAISTSRRARSAARRAAISAMTAIDSTIIELERDAPSAIASALNTVPCVVGFRFQTEHASQYLQELRETEVVDDDEHEAIAYVLRQAGDANRAMDLTQKLGLNNVEGARQLRLIALKATHLLETDDKGFTKCQIARKAISSARKHLK